MKLQNEIVTQAETLTPVCMQMLHFAQI